MSEFTEYITLDGDSELSQYNNLGVQKCQTCEFDAGIAQFNQAIRLFPDAEVLYINRAVAFQGLGFTLSAIHDAAVASNIRKNKEGIRLRKRNRTNS